MKRSGYGRGLLADGIREFAVIKTVWVALNVRPFGRSEGRSSGQTCEAAGVTGSGRTSTAGAFFKNGPGGRANTSTASTSSRRHLPGDLPAVPVVLAGSLRVGHLEPLVGGDGQSLVGDEVATRLVVEHHHIRRTGTSRPVRRGSAAVPIRLPQNAGSGLRSAGAAAALTCCARADPT